MDMDECIRWFLIVTIIRQMKAKGVFISVMVTRYYFDVVETHFRKYNF